MILNRTIIFNTNTRIMNLKLRKGIKNSKIKIFKDYDYSTEPTKLTKQIEEIY